jgi:Asp-tRNA(Asn)/Glu-tRNA(Gln) amidotransferase B subunit
MSIDLNLNLTIRIDPETLGLLRAMNRKLDTMMQTQRTDDMATQQTLAALIATTKANTDATAAAKAALDHFVAVHAEDTAKLAAAIANSDASDDADVKAAIDAINANNAALAASTPQVAAAVTDGTPAAA